MKRYDIAIVGAGPAGMTAAIVAARAGRRVVLIERNPILGRKLLATGNGRCNLTNASVSIDRYHGTHLDFIQTVLGQFDQPATLGFFGDLGLVLKKEPDGRVFPRTNQASSVVEVLRQGLSRMGVEVLLGALVVGVESSAPWRISLNDGGVIESDRLIIATGGRAAHQFGSAGDGLVWAKRLGHTLTWTHAALVPVETVEQWPGEAQGVKVEARVWATSGGDTTRESTGDALFTSYGLSGPAVMAQARDIAVMLKTKEVLLHIDLFPDMTAEELDSAIAHIFECDPNRELWDALVGLLPSGLIPVVVGFARLDGHTRVAGLTVDRRLGLAHALKDLALTVSKLRPYKEAQVTAGGIDSEEVDPRTLESKLAEGLYFAGEVLDADGDSGGFNLQWAWSSGYVAGLGAAQAE